MSNRILLLPLGGLVCFLALLNELMNPVEEPETDIRTKKRICEDITSNQMFRRTGKFPYEKHVDWLTRLVDRLDYGTTTITVIPYRGHEVISEKVFICMAREGWSNKAYYISDEFNLNAVWGRPFSDFNLAARFVFHQFKNSVSRLYAMAEIPAEAFLNPDYSVEDIYLQRREIFNTGKYSRYSVLKGHYRKCTIIDYCFSHARAVAWTAEQDALCKLKSVARERICASVLNSRYLVNRIKFADDDKFVAEDSCKLRAVTLQTEQAESDLADHDRQFKEWTLGCKLEKERVPFNYLLSHAYMTNQIFVYFLPEGDENVFLYALTNNVRLLFDPNRAWFPPAENMPEFFFDEENEGGAPKIVESPTYRRQTRSLSALLKHSSPSMAHDRSSVSSRASHSPPSRRHRISSYRQSRGRSPRCLSSTKSRSFPSY